MQAPGTTHRHALQGALDAVPVGVLLFDRRGRPVLASRSARDLLGELVALPLADWPETRLLRDPQGNALSADDLPPLATLLDGAERLEVEVQVRGPDGALARLLLCSRAVCDPDGEVIQVALSATPLSTHAARCLAEREMARLETLGSLAGNVAGPLNDALTAIEGYCELARGRLPEADPMHAIVSEIGNAGHRASVLAGRLLVHGRREVALARVLDLDRWIDARAAALDELLGEQIELGFQLRAPGRLVLADPRLLEQSLADVLANARDAMPSGGNVKISTFPAEDAASHTSIADTPAVILRVDDSGGGMLEPVLRRAFEPFFTTREGALGLGLTTVNRLMRLQGGQVGITNRRGSGVSIDLHLALAPSTATDASISGDGGRANTCVLLVEDDAHVRDLIAQVLAGEGYRVLQARDATEAGLVLHGGEEAPDLLVCDLVLPGEGGCALASRLIHEYPHLRVMLTSGASDPGTAVDALPPGRAVFLAKPFTPDVLLARAHALLRAPRPTGCPAPVTLRPTA